MSGNALPFPDIVEALVGGGFYPNAIDGNAQHNGDFLAHRHNKLPDFRALRDNRDIDIHRRIPAGTRLRNRLGENLHRIYSLASGVGWREKMPNVGQRHRAQNCVGEGVRDNVAIGVRNTPEVCGNLDPAENATASRLYAMDVVAYSNTKWRERRPALCFFCILAHV